MADKEQLIHYIKTRLKEIHEIAGYSFCPEDIYFEARANELIAELIKLGVVTLETKELLVEPENEKK